MPKHLEKYFDLAEPLKDCFASDKENVVLNLASRGWIID